MSEPFLGEIKMFGGNFAPRGYAICEAQILPIAQNAALFSILGTAFGGNGQNTFGLPDLRGRTAVGTGQGPSLSQIDLGEVGGVENVTLTYNQLPSHRHTQVISTVGGTSDVGNETMYLARAADTGGNAMNIYGSDLAGATTLSPNSLSAAGGGQPFGNRNPYLGITYIIALEGIFPSRN
ncbi:phage tail protein [Pseudomonas donghuensis]|uniref:phage tail protein n=1 Tax=Pseudomonas donghuensis TaxID=1163398 RepID=UPI000299E8CF|nr:tail fiber protein [Pseudomonas donghuensis]WSE81008.1 tail fiber protein [Pseudomonas donghuensis]